MWRLFGHRLHDLMRRLPIEIAEQAHRKKSPRGKLRDPREIIEEQQTAPLINLGAMHACPTRRRVIRLSRQMRYSRRPSMK